MKKLALLMCLTALSGCGEQAFPEEPVQAEQSIPEGEQFPSDADVVDVPEE